LKYVQRVFAHNQLWVVVSSVATLGGLVVAIAALIWDPTDNESKAEEGSLPPGLTLPMLEGLSVRGDTRFHLLMDEGQRFLAQSDFDRAFDSFDVAVKRISLDKPQPRDEALAYLFRGAADLMRGEYNYAITDFLEAHERGTPETKPLSAENLGLAYLGVGDLENAEEYLLMALHDYRRNSPGVYGGLGLLEYRYGNFRGCDDYFSLAIDAGASDAMRLPGLLYGRATCAEAMGDFELALIDIDEAIGYGGTLTDFLLDYEDALLRKCGGRPPCR
jgi:tetratricopeptide (TPR) repeat protein